MLPRLERRMFETTKYLQPFHVWDRESAPLVPGVDQMNNEMKQEQHKKKSECLSIQLPTPTTERAMVVHNNNKVHEHTNTLAALN